MNLSEYVAWIESLVVESLGELL